MIDDSLVNPSRKDEILQDLHSRIISGAWGPSFRLPTRREMAVQYGASSATVNGVLTSLIRDRFIESRGKLGTFVAEAPPHLSKYTMVFPMLPNSDEFGNFYQALAREVGSFKVSGRTVDAVYGVEGGHADNDDYIQLSRVVQRHLTAGLIFPVTPIGLVGTPVLDTPGMPKVIVATPEVLSPPFEQFSMVRLMPMVDKALAYLAERGRKRVAVLHIGSDGQYHEWVAGLKQYDMCQRPERIQAMPSLGAKWARGLVALMASRRQSEPPDALIIADDNLVQPATAGLLDAGIRVPEDMDVVAHCNFPWPTPSHLAVKRIGYHAKDIIAAAAHCIDVQRASKELCHARIIPRFEDELISVPTS